ncbi:MAG: hypothetical protein Q8M03_07660 [Legionella sp.]|nr:hypothetical protein [Legionella sp.]
MTESNLSESDVGILNDFKTRLSSLTSADNLTETDIDWLRSIVTHRWNINDSIDVEWLELVKSIDTEINESYRRILMPDKNDNDIVDENLLILKQSTNCTDLKSSRTHFDLFHLSTITDYCHLKLLTSFKLKLAEIESNITAEGYVSAASFDEIKALFSLPWMSVIDKNDDLSLSVSLDYLTFWHYLVEKSNKDWQQNGELPVNLLPELLNLIDNYYQVSTEEDFIKFNKSLRMFINSLVLYPLENLNHLYGMIVEHNGKSIYLLQLIIECFQDVSGIDSNLRSIAKWIYSVDHSLVAKSEQLIPVYQDLRAGRSFGIAQLRDLLGELNRLPPEFSSKINSKLENLQQKASRAGEIDEELLEKIRELYSMRWFEVIDTWLDYTRVLDGLNKPWISLAQCMAGAGLIDPNYYRLLIPTLKHDEGFIEAQKLTDFPLTHYILSDNNAELIYLDTCVRHYKINRTFYNWNPKKPQPLTEIEKQRVLRSLPVYANYFKQWEIETDDFVIKRSTVDEIKKLAEKSLFTDGLYSGKNYTVEQDKSAEVAYEDFLGFMATLPEDELVNLFNQRMLYKNKRLTLSDLLQRVLHPGYLHILYSNFGHLIQRVPSTEEREERPLCAALAAQHYLFKLVIDYNPEEELPSTKKYTKIERADIIEMRANSIKKVYRDYEFLIDKEAIRRFRIIYVALLTHSFGYLLIGGHKLSVWDCVNTVTNTGIKISDLLNKVLITHSENPRFAYAMMETTIREALADNSMKTSLTRSVDTEIWLKTILNGSMFEAANCTTFDPDLLLAVLWSYPIALNSKLRVPRDLFLDQLVHTLVQDEDEHLKWIRINIKFADFLKTIPERECDAILTNLRDASCTPDRHKHIIEFSCHRFALNIALDESRNRLNFFASEPQINLYQYDSFCKEFHNRLKQQNIPNDDNKLSDLLVFLHGIAKNIINNSKHQKLTHYIETLTHEIGSPTSYPQIVY